LILSRKKEKTMAGVGSQIKEKVDTGLEKLGVKKVSAAGKRILIVATSCDKLGDTSEPTGCWAEELAAPYYIFKDAGAHVDVVSIKGGPIPIDKGSLAEGFVTDHVKRYFDDEELKQYVEHSLSVKDVSGNYDALFVPGGHGIVFDGPKDKDFIALGNRFWAEGKIVSSVCHGPAGLVSMTAPDGSPIVKGHKVTGFSNSEEEAVQKTKYMPFLLEDKLKELGGLYECGPNWQPHAVADRQLITGQNPASSAKVAELVLEALSK
jgi:putative intracellular protease/amidase